MSILIFILIVLVVVSLLIYAVNCLNVLQPTIKQLIQAVLLIGAALVICQRAGLI